MHKKSHRLQITCSATLTDLAGVAPTEIKLAPAGLFRARDGRPHDLPGWRVTDASAAAMMKEAAARTDHFVIDYEHQTLYTQENGQPAPAAGWYSTLEWRPGDGLYAVNVEWTPAARQKIADKEYRYISPVLSFDSDTGIVTGVLMAALVNHPAIDGLNDLAAAHFSLSSHHDEYQMDKKLLALLGLPETAAETEVIAALQALVAKSEAQQTQIASLAAQTPDPAKFVPVAVVVELQSQLATLSAKMEGGEIDTLIEKNLAKLPTPALQAWARSISVQALSAFLANAPEIAALTGMQTAGKPPPDNDHHETAALSADEKQICRRMGFTQEAYLKHKAEMAAKAKEASV